MSATLRRQPAQRRGATRVEQILDACGELLDEIGYDALTTREVAKRAGSSIGSLYQYFADKPSLVQAFGQRNLDRFMARVSSLLKADPPATWPVMLNVVLDEYIELRRTTPGFGVVDFALVGDGDASRHLADGLAELIVRHFTQPDTPELRRALRVAVEAADALVRLAFQGNPHGDPDLLAETRQLISGYLAGHLS